MNAKTQKRPKSFSEQALDEVPRSAGYVRATILGLIAGCGAEKVAEGITAAIGQLHLVMPEGEIPNVSQLHGLKRILELIGESGASEVASALEEAIRVHGSVGNASTAIGAYTDHIMQRAEDYAEDPTEEASIALSDAVWRGQPDRRY